MFGYYLCFTIVLHKKPSSVVLINWFKLGATAKASVSIVCLLEQTLNPGSSTQTLRRYTHITYDGLASCPLEVEHNQLRRPVFFPHLIKMEAKFHYVLRIYFQRPNQGNLNIKYQIKVAYITILK